MGIVFYNIIGEISVCFKVTVTYKPIEQIKHVFIELSNDQRKLTLLVSVYHTQLNWL